LRQDIEDLKNLEKICALGELCLNLQNKEQLPLTGWHNCTCASCDADEEKTAIVHNLCAQAINQAVYGDAREGEFYCAKVISGKKKTHLSATVEEYSSSSDNDSDDSDSYKEKDGNQVNFQPL